MPWLTIQTFEPALPAHCEPANDFLLRFSSTFHTCVPTNLAFVSTALGTLSIVSWLFAQLPQIYKNYSLKSTSGLSIFFLVEWCLGDLSNLLGALFTHQAAWQVIIGGYYCFVDFVLVAQWLWYEKLKHGRALHKVQPGTQIEHDDDGRGNMREVVIDGIEAPDDASQQESNQDHASKHTRPRPIFRTPTFNKPKSEEEKGSLSSASTPNSRTIHRVGPSSPMPSPSPRTVLFLACLIVVCQASPIRTQATSDAVEKQSTPLENAGTILSWLSTLLYLGSRVPQLLKNWSRQSTAGLSPQLFIAAFLGNLFYSSSILTNPCAWNDYGSFGGGGWVGASGTQKADWIAAALPFFLGAAGVLGLDGAVGVQFLIYGESQEKVVVVEEDGRGRKWKWRRVSGWMRGWVPSINDAKNGERQALLESSDRIGEGYTTL